jgi:pimeloyl-ACP methyl ester carboxylesterase
MSVTTESKLLHLTMSPTPDTAERDLEARTSRVLRALARAAFGTVALVAAAAALGATYEKVAGSGELSTYPPAGRLVDVGGYRMHLDCRSEGSPTVVMDAGLGGSSLDWSLVQTDIARTTRVCTYDRAGMGWSDASPQARTPSHIADELHLLLTNAGVPGPYVLVGHSLAGKNVRMFAFAHPDEVAGMVLVDARSELVDSLTPNGEADAFRVGLQMQGALYTLARRFGVARAFGARLINQPLLSPDIATEIVLLQTRSAAIKETTNEGLARSADDAALAGSTLGSMPLIVIAAAASMADIPNWSMAQRELAALSTRGRLVIAEQSGHAAHLDQPGIVIYGIGEVLAKVRRDRQFANTRGAPSMQIALPVSRQIENQPMQTTAAHGCLPFQMHPAHCTQFQGDIE